MIQFQPHFLQTHSLSPLNPLRPLWLGLPLGFAVSSDGKLLEDRDHAYSFLHPSLLLPTHTWQSRTGSWGLGGTKENSASDSFGELLGQLAFPSH